jgi:CubicO group peptidase (beta-lactamase class C family)
MAAATGFSGAGLAALHETMAGHAAAGGVPGLVTLLARQGAVAVDAIGAATIGGPPMRRDTIFRIASMTKPVTAAAAMVLVAEGRLAHDDAVDPLLPELAGRRVLRRLDGPLDDTVPAKRPITLRDLLSLRMGLGHIMAPAAHYPIRRALDAQGLLLGPPRPEAVPAPDEWMRRVGTLPLMHQPGEGWMYDLGIDVAGVLIARAAGQPFEAFLRERIFAPLGMADTGFAVPAAEQHRLATSYAPDPATGALAVYDPVDGGWSRPPAFASGSGGLVSTVDDYLAFAAMLRAGGGRILSKAAVALMTTDQLTAEQRAGARLLLGDTKGWGLGLAVAIRGEPGGWPAGSFGWDGGLGTSAYIDPAADLVGILMTQRCWISPVPPAVRRDFWAGAYRALAA